MRRAPLARSGFFSSGTSIERAGFSSLNLFKVALIILCAKIVLASANYLAVGLNYSRCNASLA